MARTYHRDSKGRFASGGGGQLSRTKQRTNRVRVAKRDNIQARAQLSTLASVGKSGVNVSKGTNLLNKRVRQNNLAIAKAKRGSGVVRKGSGRR